MDRLAILVVDDDDLQRRSIVRTLTRFPNVDTAEASTTGAARELLAAREFAVMITDYQMGSENGLDLLEHVVTHHGRVVSILATAHADLDVALEAINRGRVYGLLTKPFSNAQLLLSVSQALEKHQLRVDLETKVAELERANELLGKANVRLAHSEDELRRAYELAATDVKTGARSYRFFSERLEEEVARALRYARPLSLGLIDLDGFKDVNDRFGHVVGDEVLASVAKVMRSSLRVVDVLARFGGDEFAIILPDTNLEGASCLGERLRSRIGDARFDPATAGAITVSIGIASIPVHDASTAEELLSLADTALYRAKDEGRNRFSLPS